MDTRAVIMGLGFALMWASAFTSARIIVADAPPLTTLALRFLIAGLLGVLIARALGQSWHLTRAQWRATLVFGICQNALYLGLNFIAMQTIEASLAAIIASAMPLMVALAGWAVYGERLSVMGSAGLVIGILGVAIIMGARIEAGVDLYGLILCVVGTLSLTFATLAMGSASSGGNFLMIVGLQMLVGCVPLAIVGLATETLEVNASWKLLAAFIYTILIPGLAATLVWFLLVNRIGRVRAATYHFLTPFFGVTIAGIVLGEALRTLDVIGVAIVMIGIFAVQRARLQVA